MSIGLQQIWAKTDPFQSILTHSLISGIVAQVIVHRVRCLPLSDRVSHGHASSGGR